MSISDRVLLDTHTFLWFITDSPRLNAINRQCIESAGTTPFLSIASVWKMAIKVGLGRLETDDQPFDAFIADELTRNRLTLLDVTLAHTARVTTLPLVHRDPFDRMLIVQAMVEQMPIISADAAFDAYPVTRIW